MILLHLQADSLLEQQMIARHILKSLTHHQFCSLKYSCINTNIENPLLDCAVDSFGLVLKNVFPALASDASFNSVAALAPILPVACLPKLC